MARRKYKAEEVIQHLRTAEIAQGKGTSLEEAARMVGETPQTLVRWRKEYGGMQVSQAKRLKELEADNSRLKKIVANQAVDIDILKVAASGNF